MPKRNYSNLSDEDALYFNKRTRHDEPVDSHPNQSGNDILDFLGEWGFCCY